MLCSRHLRLLGLLCLRHLLLFTLRRLCGKGLLGLLNRRESVVNLSLHRLLCLLKLGVRRVRHYERPVRFGDGGETCHSSGGVALFEQRLEDEHASVLCLLLLFLPLVEENLALMFAFLFGDISRIAFEP